MTHKEMIALAAVVLAAGTIMWGSLILSTGMVMGLMSLATMVILYNRMPLLKKFANRYPAFVDVGAGVLTYVMFSGTIIGLVAAAVVGIGSSILMNIQLERHRCDREAAFCSAL